jgi:DinB superfamily
MNAECTRIAEQLASTLNGEAWYGDSLREILEGVTAIQALSRPIPSAHSIWELVLHLEAWCKLADGAVQGVAIPAWATMPKEQDWPPVVENGQQAWQQAAASCFASHSKLAEAVKNFEDERLGSTVPGRTYNFYRLFQSVTQHAVYHGGQIVLLKKALRDR